MDSYKESFETWNKVASLYEDKFMHLDLYNETYDFICNAVPTNNATILEIGCGPGNITKYLLAKRPDWNIYGIDIAPNMIAIAKRNNPTAHFAVMDCRQISELTTTFNGIICGFCLPYLSQADSTIFISNAYRLLSDTGLIYISFVEGDPNQSGYRIGSTGDRTYFYYYTLESLMAQLREIGFTAPTLFKVAYEKVGAEEEMHTILIAKKQPIAFTNPSQ